jgi:hypothetical protein
MLYDGREKEYQSEIRYEYRSDPDSKYGSQPQNESNPADGRIENSTIVLD